MEGIDMMKSHHSAGFQHNEGLEDRNFLGSGASAWFKASLLAESALLAGRIAEVCEGRTLPDLDLRTSVLRVQLVTSTHGTVQCRRGGPSPCDLCGRPGAGDDI